MAGESLDRVEVGPLGLLGDRRFALLDVQSGKIASAKNPALWGKLLHLRATQDGDAVSVSLGGSRYSTNDPALSAALSAELGREVKVIEVPPAKAVIEQVFSDAEAYPGHKIDHPLGQGAPGTFFDFAAVHVIASSTLDFLRQELSANEADALRFRANVVIDTPNAPPFVENSWTNKGLLVGGVVLGIITPAPRCVMTTLSHGESLPAAPSLLRALSKSNKLPIADLGQFACAGSYALVKQPGTIARGEEVRVL